VSFLRVVRWEMFKLVKRRASYIGFVLCVIFCFAVLIGFYFSEFKGLRRYSGFIDPARFINGWLFAYFATSISFFTLLPLLAAVVPGSQLAGEAKEGTLRALLVRPPSRPSVFAAKALVSFVWLLLLVYVLIFASLLLGHLLLGGGPFLVFEWEFRTTSFVADSGDRLLIFLISGAGVALSLYMVAAFALMLSSMTDNPVIANVGTLGAFFTSSIIHQLPDELMSTQVKDLMPTMHMRFWRELPRLFHPDPEIFDAGRVWSDLAWVGGYIGLFLVIGLIVFCRRDITS